MDNMKRDMHLQADSARRAGWSGAALAGQQANPSVLEQEPAPMPEATAMMPMPPSQRTVIGTAPMDTEDSGCLHMVLAMSYIPWQQFRDLYEPEEGFGRGTIFAELDYPFVGKGNCRND